MQFFVQILGVIYKDVNIQQFYWFFESFSSDLSETVSIKWRERVVWKKWRNKSPVQKH